MLKLLTVTAGLFACLAGGDKDTHNRHFLIEVGGNENIATDVNEVDRKKSMAKMTNVRWEKS